MAQYGYDSWAVLEWECCLKQPEDGAREGAEFIKSHLIRVTERAFDEFAGGGSDEERIRRMLGLVDGRIASGHNRGKHNDNPRSRAARRGRISLGMVGGGEGAFIGAVHPIVARLDDEYVLAAGALSSTPEKARRSGLAIGLEASRTYADYNEMARKEAQLEDGVEVVAIVTPNNEHMPAALAFLEAGVHVICDKPLTTLENALKLKAGVQQSGRIFALTHTGYPMVRQAREMVRAGELGDIRIVQAEYPQDWLTEWLEVTGQKQAGWRTDPAWAGVGGCIGDIGTHAYNLADFIVGVPLKELCAELTTFVEGRSLDDNAQILLRYANGARGALWSSQVAPGNDNGLRIRVYGTRGGLEWNQVNPNYLLWSAFGRPTQIIARGSPAAGAAATRVTRIPPGHPEDYLEGFANIYQEVPTRSVQPEPV
jgi:predicted dehydrogenase